MSVNKNKPYEERKISRIDTKRGTHGYEVRFQSKFNKLVKQNEFFNDNKFGGKAGALEAAKVFRDTMEQIIDSKNESYHLNKKVKSRNVSGHVGVYRTKLTSKKKNHIYKYDVWVAHYPVKKNKQTNKSFYIHKHGEVEALRLAIEARKRGVEAYYAQIQNNNKNNLLFSAPKNPNIKIWRYFDFTKFVSLLADKGLFFPTSIHFNDQFEGSFSFVNKKLRPLIYKHLGIHHNINEISSFYKNLRSWVGISCWHMNEFESAGMWSLYSKMDESICIQSTYQKLRNLLNKDIQIGEVRYVDYNKEWIPEKDILSPFFYKRKSFEHERELRAIINFSGKHDFSDLNFPDKKPIEGNLVKLDLKNLIENVFVSPNSSNWFFNLVQNIVSVYKLKIPVVRSSLEEEPFY
jgi:hypothetical protein